MDEEEKKLAAEAAARKRREERRKDKERKKEARRKAAEEAARREKDAPGSIGSSGGSGIEGEKKPKERKPKADLPEDLTLTVRELESVKPGPGETGETYKKLYDSLFPAEVYRAYNTLQTFARQLNAQVAYPEVVLLGSSGSGKSSLLEAFLGNVFNHVDADGATQRPIYFTMVNNVDCETPKFTIKRDPILKEFDHDVEVPLADLSDAIKARNGKSSKDGIFITYEYRYCHNMTFIDTPGLGTSESIDAIALDLARPVGRHILCVDECGDEEGVSTLDYIKKVDPELARTTFVFTKFHAKLRNLTSTADINRFLAKSLPDSKIFFVSLPNAGIRSKFSETDEFEQKIWQCYRRDLTFLESHQFDKRFQGSIGVHALRKFLLNRTWRAYQDTIPSILKRLRQRKADSQLALKSIQTQLTQFGSTHLRSIANDYVVNFLQTIQTLIAGTSEGNPAVNGQTLSEEKHTHGDGEWRNAQNGIITVNPEEYKIPYWNSKLYGGHQFERLLAEFRAVAKNAKIEPPSMDDVATAAGINKLNNIPNYNWAASDLAQQKSVEVLVPLIKQLSSRAVFVLKRLVPITNTILKARQKRSTITASDINDMSQYPFFVHHIRELFENFIDNQAKVCLSKCMDEFYSTRTIYWHITEIPSEELKMDMPAVVDPEEAKKQVAEKSQLVFNSLRERIVKNILLKFYNFFLVPIQTKLWNAIHGQISTLSLEDLESKFEVDATTTRLKDEEKRIEEDVKKYIEQEAEFLKSSTKFSHPILTATEEES
eukprot:TRINITY_DN5126_c0_g2_i1.p1 TRINITY_DN5126_c0_g2~~TRINITY_DN5126_c0_g2_i1.p1  ORF type:complete len:772 (+),score=212.08 TRINITY_DN5126_c0_g2_i1:32-2347(+)